MKEFKGTPGPWVASTTDRSIGPVSNDDDQSYGMILPVAWVEHDGDIGYQKPNAQLIAAAPELLEALQTLNQAIDYGTSMDVVQAQEVAQDVIAKALGENK